MQSALLTKGKTYSKHAGVIGGFSEHFIKAGIFPTNFGESIQRLRKDRELGDYGYQISLSLKESSRDVKTACRIVDALLKYLKPFVS